MRERTLIMTVGTSLFSSASWKNEGEIAKVRHYKSWLTQKYLENPGLRRSQGWKTSAALEKAIRENPEGTAEAFELEDYKPLRYSGEITTLLRVFLKESEGGEGFPEFLRRRYSKIRLVASADAENPSNIVARHLRAILRDRLSHPDVEIAAVLQGLALTELIARFRDYLAALTRQPEGERVDLLVTGGYKAFSILAGHAVTTQPEGTDWRALYLHEDDLLSLVIERLDETGQKEMEAGDGGSTKIVVWPRVVRSTRR